MVSTRGTRAAARQPAVEETPKSPKARASSAGRRAAAAPAAPASPPASPPTSPKRSQSAKRTRGPAPPTPVTPTVVQHRPDVVRLDQAVVDAAATPLPADDPSPSLVRRTRVAPLSPAVTPKATSRRPSRNAAAGGAAGARGGGAAGARGGGAHLLPVLLAVLLGTGGGGFYYVQQNPEVAEALTGAAAAAAAQAQLQAAQAAALARSHAGGISARGAQAWRDAAALAEQLQGAAGEKLASIIASGGSFSSSFSAGSAPAFKPVWEASQVAAILPDTPAWNAVAEDVAERLTSAASDSGPGRKGVGLLLGCATASDCDTALGALKGLSGVPPGCVLVLDGASYADDPPSAAALLQAALAGFLRRCPAGLAAVSNAQALPVQALPALHSALSELGGFQHSGDVDASRAVYALLVQLPSASEARAVVESGDPSDAANWLKSLYFDEALAAEADALAEQHGEEGRAYGPLVRALRRRVDFAAITRLGAAANAEANAEDAEIAAARAQGGGGDVEGELEFDGRKWVRTEVSDDESAGEWVPFEQPLEFAGGEEEE